MRLNKAAAIVLAATLGIVGAWAQTKPVVAVLSSDSPLFSTATVSETRVGARLSVGEPLLIVGSQAAKIVLDGVPTLWYQVKTAESATGWIPGSRLSFTATAFKRSAFQTQDQYVAYIIMAARPGEKVVATRSYEKVSKGDTGYFVASNDEALPVTVVWERNLAATPSEEYLPAGFPPELMPFVYYVEWPIIELAGEQNASSLKDLAKTLPKKYPVEDGFYAEAIDEDIAWYMPSETSYGSTDYGYEEEYGDDYAYSEEEYGDYDDSYDPDFIEGTESYGFIKVGSTVILGQHADINGGDNWADEMEAFVGKEAVVTELPGEDGQGFLCVRVKGNGYAWRVRDVALKGRGEKGSYGYKVGDRVIIGAHRYIDEDNNWAEDMAAYVGQTAKITSFEGTDGTESPIVHVDIDNGDWYWRLETLSPAP
ncbi:MAG: hypothetical protein A2Y38_08540 [Spirochaetes bacterium GWB1_59_5]|nr:MAG: hypothetical protein A2Y38_08540 [Spirochaetes bacterium GWB1_59_5]